MAARARAIALGALVAAALAVGFGGVAAAQDHVGHDHAGHDHAGHRHGAPPVRFAPQPVPAQAQPQPLPPGADRPTLPTATVATPERPATTGKGTAIAFWAFSLLAVGGAIATITRRNAVVATMSLVGTFIAVAAVYVMLFAHFLAAIQVLVYAGAIMVLFVFVVMILNKDEDEPWALRGWIGKVLAGGALVYLLVRLVDILWDVKDRVAEPAWRQGEFATYGTTKALGKELFTSYLFPFEAVSVVLLIAVIGALVLAHPDHPTAAGETEPKA